MSDILSTSSFAYMFTVFADYDEARLRALFKALESVG